MLVVVYFQCRASTGESEAGNDRQGSSALAGMGLQAEGDTQGGSNHKFSCRRIMLADTSC